MPSHARGTGRSRALAAAALLLFQLWCLYPQQRTMDLPVWDELTFYAAQGQRILLGVGGLQSIEYGPLYSLLYVPVLALVDLDEAIFVMRYVWTLVVTLGLFALLARALDSTRAAFLLALVWAASDANLGIGTMAYHVALALTLAALLLASRSRLAAVLALALAGFVRPEAFVLAAGYGALLLARRLGAPLPGRGAERSGAGPPWLGPAWCRAVVVGELLVLTVLVAKVASWRFDTGRSWLALQQHYAFAQVIAGRYAVDPWADFAYVTQRDMPGASSVADVLRSHPRAVLAHLWQNVASVPGALARFVTPLRPLRGPIGLGVVLPSAVLVAAAWMRRDRVQFRVVRGALLERAGDAPLLALVAPCTLLPTALVSWRHPQYMFAMVPFAALGAGIFGVASVRSLAPSPGGGRRAMARAARTFPAVVAIGLVALAAIAPPPFGVERVARVEQPVRAKVAALRALVQPPPAVVYGGSLPSFLAYLSPTSRAVYPLSQGERIDLRADLARERPALVAIDASLLCSPFFDPTGLAALAEPEWRCGPFADEVVYVRVEPDGSPAIAPHPKAHDIQGRDPDAHGEHTLLLPRNWRAWGHDRHLTHDETHRILAVPGGFWVFTERPRRATLTVAPHRDGLGVPTVLPYTTGVLLNGIRATELAVDAGRPVTLELDLGAGFNQIWLGDAPGSPGGGFVPAAAGAEPPTPGLHPLDLVSFELAR